MTMEKRGVLNQTNMKKFALDVIDKLIAIDKTMNKSMYEMAKLLATVRENQLYKVVGYETFAGFVSEELSFGPNSANTHINVYNHFRRLHYKDQEAARLIERFGFTAMAKVLPNLKQKTSTRTISKHVEAQPMAVSFWLSPEDYERIEKVFKSFGLEISRETGRWRNSTEVFTRMMAILEHMPKKTNQKAA